MVKHQQLRDTVVDTELATFFLMSLRFASWN